MFEILNHSKTMRLLLVEDEQGLAKPLKKSLEKTGFAVDWAEDGEDGLHLAQINEYDCILLDLNLPKIDGLQVAGTLRETSATEKRRSVPILMLTARSQLYDKLDGFENGADDYVTKPFNLRELIARIKALIKRNSVNESERLFLGPYELLPDENKVVRYKKEHAAHEVALSNKETAVLEYLIRNKGKIVSAEELLEHVWDREVDMFTQTVKTHIKTLRKKIDPEKKFIRTVRGKGYQVQ